MEQKKKEQEKSQSPLLEQKRQEHMNAGELVNKGADLLKQGKAKEALPYLQKAWDLEPGEIAAAINLAGAYILLNHHQEAVPILETAMSIAPENAMVWMNLGAAYLGNPILASSEQQEQAIEAFKRAAELQPGIRNVNYNIGLIYQDRQDWASARDHFQRALEMNPKDRDAKMFMEQAIEKLTGGIKEETEEQV